MQNAEKSARAKWYWAYVCAFLFMCALGVLAMPFAGEDGATENRSLAPFPALAGGDSILSWPARFEDWLNDHIGLRKYYTEAYARMLYALGASADGQVIVGKEGWMFYAPTISDYTGVGAPDEAALNRIGERLKDISERLKASGVRFAVMVAPNKNSVYPEFMPLNYPRAETTPRLMDMFPDIDFINVEGALQKLREEGLYYKTDTHWNEKGARIAASLCIERINALCESNAPVPDTGQPFVEAGEHTGDLAKMLFPVYTPAEPLFAFADAKQKYTTLGRYRGANDITIKTAGGEADISVLVLRDSFCDALLPYISNAFDRVCYSRAWPPVIDLSEGYDVVVLEIAQRRLGELADADFTIAGGDHMLMG